MLCWRDSLYSLPRLLVCGCVCYIDGLRVGRVDYQVFDRVLIVERLILPILLLRQDVEKLLGQVAGVLAGWDACLGSGVIPDG